MERKHLLLIPIMPIIIQINELPLLWHFNLGPPKDVSRPGFTPYIASVDKDFYFK